MTVGIATNIVVHGDRAITRLISLPDEELTASSFNSSAAGFNASSTSFASNAAYSRSSLSRLLAPSLKRRVRIQRTAGSEDRNEPTYRRGDNRRFKVHNDGFAQHISEARVHEAVEFGQAGTSEFDAG